MNKIPKWLIVLLLIGLIAALAGGTVFYFLTYHPENTFTKSVIIPVMKPLVDKISGLKKHQAVEGAEPAFTMSTNDLYNSFAVSEADATTDFIGKVIQVSGIVSNVAGAGDQPVIL